ncbi:Protein trichome birefringence-like [Actinidia chinensis var. chinensis]|uniref:Protein trichome birefringence-like n=1 Tax=Actinidia chinensis var. chinensis TaxID=1590841 RepID=A0A2R6QRR2_ACTCC|nr:Protein trichome birefringence-like [Actinidia chinensis var. chinensis]
MRVSKAILLIILIIVIVALIRPNHRENPPPSSQYQRAANNASSDLIRLGQKCDIFRGKWVPYPKGPLYTNTSGCGIEDGVSCIKFGRDTEYTKWRWKPDGCELPVFNPTRFLELVRGKAMAFVGDSVARNQYKSLKCMLHSVARPVNQTTETGTRVKRYFYTHYNFTLVYIGSTHLVKAVDVDPFSLKPARLHLEEPDETWASRVENMDYVIISAGHWFSRPLIYVEKNKITGCDMCRSNNVTDLTRYYGYKKAFQTAFGTLVDRLNFKGTVILRTISPTHFEPEYWEGRGNCVRKRPFTRDEIRIDWYLNMFLKVQMEEFRAAEREGRERGLRFRVLDVTEAMRFRPDAHPNHYGHPPGHPKRYADCLHWCMPGPIDTWNELLLQMLKSENKEGSEDGKGLL